MKTLIKNGNRHEFAYHGKPLPLNEDGSVRYNEMTSRIERVYSERIDGKIRRDLSKIL